MSVSKRVRFEVLRRDNHTCQYCGGIAPDYVLTVDHVVPIALGGTDAPGNLVAACRDCNAGKTSVHPDAPIVERVSAASAAFALGLRGALTEQAEAVRAELEAVTFFEDMWHALTPQHKRSSWYLPDDYADAVMRWHRMGVSDDIFEYAIRIAFGKKDVTGGGKFLYTAGIIWTTIRKAEAEALHQADGPGSGSMSDYDRGYEDGAEEQSKADTKYFIFRHMTDELLTRVVDGYPCPTVYLRARKAA